MVSYVAAPTTCQGSEHLSLKAIWELLDKQQSEQTRQGGMFIDLGYKHWKSPDLPQLRGTCQDLGWYLDDPQSPHAALVYCGFPEMQVLFLPK